MTQIELIDILTGNHIDLQIPVLVKGFELIKLLFLLRRKIRKILVKQCGFHGFPRILHKNTIFSFYQRLLESP